MSQRFRLPSLTLAFFSFWLLLARADDPPALGRDGKADAAKAPEVRGARKVKATRRPPRRKAADQPPACTAHRRAAAPPAQSMPELFERMGRSFATNPATGFNTFLGELARMEEPALQGITVTLDEERRAGRQARDDYLARAKARGYQMVTDAIRLDYLHSIVDRLAARMTHRDRYPKIDVTLIHAPISDGQSFPGGFLAFTTALLDEPDEATVAGVIAHELAHLDLG